MSTVGLGTILKACSYADMRCSDARLQRSNENDEVESQFGGKDCRGICYSKGDSAEQQVW